MSIRHPALHCALAAGLLLSCGVVVVPADAVGAPLQGAVETQPPRPERRGVLRNRIQPVLWEGRVGPEDAPTGGEPVECAAVPCDHFRLRIDLPRGTFDDPNRPGGVQVALRWFGNPSRTTVGTTCGLPMTPRATSRRRSSTRPWPKSSTCPWSIHRSGCCQT